LGKTEEGIGILRIPGSPLVLENSTQDGNP